MEVHEEKEITDMENKDSQKKRKRKPKELCGGRTRGRPLAKLFGVKINRGDGMIPQKIYDRESENKQAIGMVGEDKDNLLLLSGPQDTFISVYDMLRINVDLRHTDSSTTRSTDNIKYEIGWYLNCHRKDFNKPLQELIEGDNGMTATVFLVVFSNAVQATVEVTLIEYGRDNKGGHTVGVYGPFAASNDMITDEDYVSMLFQKDSGLCVQVAPGNCIPLSRSIVAMPLNSNLLVCADLYTSEKNSYDDITKGIAYFPAKLTFSSRLSGTSQTNI